MNFIKNEAYFKGRGAQVNTHNKFAAQHYVTTHIEGLDEPLLENSRTELIDEHPKKVISVNDSPDLPFMYSVNPYQGCEHGCIYCYARNTHEYWGYSAGLDFERKIVVKRDVAKILEQQFNQKSYKPEVIMLSGNTDCYQPIERKLKLTRGILEVMLKYRHPVAIISKNNLIIRDLDILQELAKLQLVHVAVTINSLSEDLRQKMEPRTVTAQSRLRVIEKLATNEIPVMLMCAPIVPGLNSDEMPEIIKAAAENGAQSAAYTLVRLNGAIADIFKDWVHKAYPDRAQKILNNIAACHGGKLNDNRWGDRMRGDGQVAESIRQLFHIAVKRYMHGGNRPQLRTDLFTPAGGRQMSLF